MLSATPMVRPPRTRIRPTRAPVRISAPKDSAALRHAVDDFDSGTDARRALEVILNEARIRDTLTLWHLLSRVDPSDRERVYDRIAALAPPPVRVSRDQILALDADALRRWREELAWKW